MSFSNLSSFVDTLRKRKELLEINVLVDPHLELAEIHRRIIAEQGPALLFSNVSGSSFPVVTNLFGTKDRVELAFGTAGIKFVETAASLAHELIPPSLSKIWAQRQFFTRLLKSGTKTKKVGPILSNMQVPPNLDSLPIITSWKEDGGPFITLPLVYTEDMSGGIHNLGIYRMHKYSSSTTGMHMQIGKGGGFHLEQAKSMGVNLPLNVFIGGPPVVILSAISPLPENVPELLLASVMLGGKVKLTTNPAGPLPLLSEAEFVLVGSVNPQELHPEGPFGDHYGYYSLQHDFPVFRCQALFHRKNAIYPATVVGKPRQEDYFIGNYLQELLSPLFPLVMPAVSDLWSYGETGYHSLAAAVVKERYKREAMVSAFRILGEGQLSLTKFLLVLDKNLDLQDFPCVLEYILERADFRTDMYIFSNLSMDTLDYTGPKLNEGSKCVLLGMGNPIRELPGEFTSDVPHGIEHAQVFCKGCLVLSGPSYQNEPQAATQIASSPQLNNWPIVILCDNAKFTAADSASFLWSVFTRFNPGTDIYSSKIELKQFHPSLNTPLVIDCRMKTNYPDELECDPETKQLVDRRWREYFKT